MRQNQPPHASAHPHEVCKGLDHLRSELARVEALGGEGLMLRQPGSAYVVGRSATLLKVKSFFDAEARVIEHQPGAGRHRGRLGALLVELPNGQRFSVGTGFSDAQREAPPPLGSVITFRYQELSDGGVPRFPVYVAVRQDEPEDAPPPPLPPIKARPKRK
jgi:DNA ligase-1